jgi:hypothetical protein
VKLNVHSRAEAIAMASQPDLFHRNGHTAERAASGW